MSERKSSEGLERLINTPEDKEEREEVQQLSGLGNQTYRE